MVPHYDNLMFNGIKPCLNFLFAHGLIIWHKNTKNQQVFDFIKRKSDLFYQVAYVLKTRYCD